ncbi:hypothetical protein J9303_04160 [Bacillaceae bacterium Marseille-Q3522]|nr:hypothetical protein [Bacillaceae bacterium Marseille-Q3522]
MKTIHLSIEEVIFCFYSEGLFEQGQGLKQTYFPELTDEQLEFMLQISCRSLLAKDMVKYDQHVYKLKDEYKPYIQALNHADYSLKAAKFVPGEQQQKSIHFHFTDKEIFSHKLLHDEQIHQISRMNSKDEVIEMLREFFVLKVFKGENEPLFVLDSEKFEALLQAANESPEMIGEIIPPLDRKNGLVDDFINDLIARRGMMDSITQFEFDTGNQPELTELVFIISGKNYIWWINGGIHNEFTLWIANNEMLKAVTSKVNRSLI